MRKLLLIFSICFFSFSIFAAKSKFDRSKELKSVDREMHFLELRSKKEIGDKKNSNLKRYTIAILTAREFKLVGMKNKSLEFYRLANEIKIDLDKKEIKEALKKKDSNDQTLPLFFFDINIKDLISTKQFEKAIVAINPDAFSIKENDSTRIIYDLLNVKIKKLAVKKLYCLDHFQKDLEGTNYESILCDFLNEYLKDGKKEASHVTYVEEYFFKNDLKERYLLDILHEL